MFNRVAYAREQITDCECHAKHIDDPQMQHELRKLAAQYLAEAEEIESKPAGDDPAVNLRQRLRKMSDGRRLVIADTARLDPPRLALRP